MLSEQHSLSFQTPIPHLTRRMLPTKQDYNIFLKSDQPDLYASVSSYFPTANQTMLLFMPKYFRSTFAGCTGFKDCLLMRQRKVHYPKVFLSHSSTNLVLWRQGWTVEYRGILFGVEGGWFKNSVEDRGQRERGTGGGSPLARGSGGSCNLVEAISLHIVKVS